MGKDRGIAALARSVEESDRRGDREGLLFWEGDDCPALALADD